MEMISVRLHHYGCALTALLLHGDVWRFLYLLVALLCALGFSMMRR